MRKRVDGGRRSRHPHRKRRSPLEHRLGGLFLMQELFGLTAQDLLPVAQSLSLRPFAAKQLAQWIYARRVASFDEMTDLPKEARERLKEGFSLGFGAPVRRTQSADGT